ncbi:MAG: hypothetical protein KF889_28075 [Alphaproteobacteria bacterium]|nr:hypothetical protein [Alphaproteobacteria bacterium]MCW5743813.1 hypothetical protein [Alphaproteobacteria bacterium]
MAALPSKAEKLAHNAVLTLFARAAMVGTCALGGWNLKTTVETQSAVQRVPDQLVVLEARVNQRLVPLEGRQMTQSDRLRDQDAKIDMLTDKVTQITVQVAVLVERINALIEDQRRQTKRQ